MGQTIRTTVKPSIVEKEKSLVIDPDFLEFGNSKFPKMEIIEFRYGVKPIDGYRFVIGRIYCIDVKNSEGEILKIRLKSLYRIKRKKLGEKYSLILNAISENYVYDIINNYIVLFNNKIDFNILGVTFTQEGIFLDKKSELISWFDLDTRNYWSYFLLSSDKKSDRYKTFYYLTEWNSFVLYAVTRHILKSKILF